MRTFIRLLFITLTISLVPVESTFAEKEPRQTASYKAPGHDRFHHWYQQIQVQLGISGCCDALNNDCGPTKTKFSSGYWYVLLEDGAWHQFTGSKIFFVNTPDSGAHVCRKPKDPKLGGYYFYCLFLPASGV